jgi:hypothetical protein
MSQVDKEIEELLRLHPVVPKKKKPKPPDLKVASTADPSVEVLRANAARAQERVHEEERRQFRPNEALIRNFRLHGRARPLPPDEQHRLNLQFALNAAMERQHCERKHERWLRRQADPYNLGLYGDVND